MLATVEGLETLESALVDTRHTRGTDCTLAGVIKVKLAQGTALGRASGYVHAAIDAAPGFGAGHRPLWHGVEGTGW